MKVLISDTARQILKRLPDSLDLRHGCRNCHQGAEWCRVVIQHQVAEWSGQKLTNDCQQASICGTARQKLTTLQARVLL